MKVLAMYLPQFHKVKENDEWWGEGFTDWVSAKNAKPLFEGHYQPHIPMNNNYYDLLDKKTMQWQAGLMHKYGIDGMCIYHYWFKDGRRILEKPAENLLKWKDIDMPFCFCWANDTWTRSWSTYKKGNVWTDICEPDNSGCDNGILLEQEYGNEYEWKKHFEYLLPFFKDKRYISKDGKPLFVIYMSAEIYCLKEMIDYFNNLAIINGLPGIYFICANCDRNFPENIDASLIHEPQNVLRSLSVELFVNTAKVFDYDLCYNRILQYDKSYGKTYYGGFVSYDDTPRRGIKGAVINNATPEKFKNNLIKLIAKNKLNGNEFLFINAWNEWGEGMHLEPDEKWGYQYLESINMAKSEYNQLEKEGADYKFKEPTYDIELIRKNSLKYEIYLNTLDVWMELREKNVSLEYYFINHGYNRIAVYGYGIFARHLINELKNSSIRIEVLIDKQRDKISCEIPKILPDDELGDLDVIVVTSFYYFKEIKSVYAKKGIEIISIESIIEEVAEIYKNR